MNNKIKIFLLCFISFVSLVLLFYKSNVVYAEEECEFDKNWQNVITDHESLTQIDFLKTAPAEYVDTNQTLSTDIKIYRSSTDSTKIAFVYSGIIMAPSDCTTLFAGCTLVANFNFENFDTTQVIRTISMFSQCTSVISLDLSGFITPKLLGTTNMFGSCTNLSYLDISSLDTSNVVNMNNMFAGCSNLNGTFGKNGTGVKIGENFKTEKVATMQSMFSKCGKIVSFDFGSFDFKSLGSNPVFRDVTNGFFKDCTFNVLIAPQNIPEGIEINLGGGKYYDKVTNAQYTILDSSLAGRRLIKHNVHTFVDCVCTTCGFIDHNYGDWIEEIPAFCGNIGTKAHYHCDKCNKNFDAQYQEITDLTIIATEHDYSENWSMDEHSHWHECPCGLKNEEANHTFGDWVIEVEPTPTVPGKRIRSCTVCGYKETETIYHTHEYLEEWKNDAEYHWHECSCGEKSEKVAHIFEDWQITKEPTIYESGSKERNCSVCQYKEIETLPQIPHTHEYADEWKYNEEYHWHECSCGEKGSEQAHSYGEWTVIKEATIHETGEKQRECNICKYKQTESIPAIPHTHEYADEWKTDAEHHWHACNCGEKGDFDVHHFNAWIVTKEATIYESGEKQRECNICKYKQTESIPAIPHTHEYADEWKYNEECHWHECSCGEKSSKQPHTYGEWKVIKEATSNETGLEEQTCICGHKNTRIIPLLPNSSSTGLVIGMSILGAVLFLLFTYWMMYILWSKKGKGLKFLIPSFTWIKQKIKKK